MSSTDLLVSVIAKIERTKEHIRDLQEVFAAFGQTNPYLTVAYSDLESRYYLIRLDRIEPLPPRALAILGDAVHCLRSSLDHLACQLVIVNGGAISDNTSFPIAYSRKKFETDGLRVVEGASDRAKRLITSLEPYKGGSGDAFWRLHRLDVIDKHRLLITTAVAVSAVTVNDIRLPLKLFQPNTRVQFGRFGKPPPLAPVECGTILFTANPAKIDIKAITDKEIKFSFEIAFGEIFEGQAVVPRLLQLTQFVEKIVAMFNPLFKFRNRPVTGQDS